MNLALVAAVAAQQLQWRSCDGGGARGGVCNDDGGKEAVASVSRYFEAEDGSSSGPVSTEQ